MNKDFDIIIKITRMAKEPKEGKDTKKFMSNGRLDFKKVDRYLLRNKETAKETAKEAEERRREKEEFNKKLQNHEKNITYVLEMIKDLEDNKTEKSHPVNES